MNRRDALKGVGTLAIAALCGLSAVAAAVDNPNNLPLLQGTRDGRILQSIDGGQTWTRVANFGSQFSVDRLQVVGNRVYAYMSTAGKSFVLSSADARTWVNAAQ